VDTIVKMAVDYGMSLNFPNESLIIALLIVQFNKAIIKLSFGKFKDIP
jgi:UMF1 family MFS transporter